VANDRSAMAHFLLLGFFFLSQGLWLLIRVCLLLAHRGPAAPENLDELLRNC
jgi:hypothetical protein